MSCDFERGMGLSDLWLMSSPLSFVFFYALVRSGMIQVILNEHSIVRVEGFEQKFNVSLVVRHYLYKYWTFDNDIMLLKVKGDCGMWHEVVFSQKYWFDIDPVNMAMSWKKCRLLTDNTDIVSDLKHDSEADYREKGSDKCNKLSKLFNT